MSVPGGSPWAWGAGRGPSGGERVPSRLRFRGKLTVFTVLCEQYQPSLRRDPMYNEYLDRIGQLFFGVTPKQTSAYGGLLGNLLSSLMGSSEQEGEDSQDDGSPIELD